jgi:hypothetical protein
VSAAKNHGFKKTTLGAEYCALAPVGMPERYLDFTRKCMERVQTMTLPGLPTSPKFNSEQCKYLVGKLEMAVESASSFLVLLNGGYFWFPESLIDMENCLENFKLLYALAKDVETFIQTCCKGEWIRAAVTMQNVLEHVSSVGFNLMLWTAVFPDTKALRERRSLTLTEVDNIFKAEVESVKAKALMDAETLLANLTELLQIQKSTSEEDQLAALLHERVERSRRLLVGDASGPSSQLSLSQTPVENLKQMEKVGKGSVATVYRAMWLGAEVAKKTFYGPEFPYFVKEVSNIAGLLHPNITTMLCFAKDKRECSIVMELMDEDLFSLIQRRLQSNNAGEFPFGILEGVDIMLQVGRYAFPA